MTGSIKKLYPVIKYIAFSLIFIGNLSFAFDPPSRALNTNLNYKPYRYIQDFESVDPFVKETSNGTYTVHYKGLTSERFRTGQKSFKVDVTLHTATKLYFLIPVKIPTEGALKFYGDLFVEKTEKASATLGALMSYKPAPVVGQVHRLGGIDRPTSSWIRQQTNLVAWGFKDAARICKKRFAMATPEDVGIWTTHLSLLIYAPSGGRISLYLDDLVLDGSIPDVQEYRRKVNLAWQKYLAKIKLDIDSKFQNIKKLSKHNHSPWDNEVESCAQKINRNLIVKPYLAPEEYKELDKIKYDLRSSFQTLSHTSKHPDTALIPFPWQPITSKRVLPFTSTNLLGKPGYNLSLQACRGEFEPASFILHARRQTENINIKASDLINSKGDVIPASSLDIHLVKCWYQSDDNTIRQREGRILVPELLLKDDSLVLVDYKKKMNYLKVKLNGKEQYINISLPEATFPDDAKVEDALELKPFNLAKNLNKQIWITVHIPTNADSGEYIGTIFVYDAQNDDPLLEINLSVTVLPFKLEPSILEYAIYYRGKVADKKISHIGSEQKNIEQYEIELKDIKEHGIQYPTFYQYFNERLLHKALSIRNKSGLPKNKIYIQGIRTDTPTDEKSLSSFMKKLNTWNHIISQYGYKSIYVYGIDEAKGEKLRSQCPVWRSVHELGLGVFVSCDIGAVDIVGDLVDVAVLYGEHDLSEILTEVAEWHKKKQRVLSYGNPQSGIENPEIYRRNYGLSLLIAGYDGAMVYAYQHDMGHIWNDFDHRKYRDHVFAYPTSCGIIKTIQWEGLREGIDDVRYFTTFISNATKNQSPFAELADWLINSRSTEMYEYRFTLIATIVENMDLVSSQQPVRQ